MVHRLNEINPKYNARIVTLEYDGSEAYELKIKTKFCYGNLDRNACENQDIIKLEKSIGNHAVCLMDLPNGVTLMIDPTNLNIGYIKNKNIKYFDIKTKYKVNKLGSFAFDGNKISKTIKNNIELPFKNLISYEQLNQKYGVKMQENALEHIKYIDKQSNNIHNKSL